MKKILLVDDEHSFLQILDMALSKYFETYTATGVREAIDILKQNTIGLICSDLYMRDGTGVDLLKEVKKSHKNISFILLYGAIFIPKGEVNLIESIIAVANDNCKSDK